MNWVCLQIGAREHYAIPRILYRNQKLEFFYTDFWANSLWQNVGNLMGKPNLATRFHHELPHTKVKSFDLTTLVDSIFGRSHKKNTYDWYLYVGRDFGRSVVESLKREKGVNWTETVLFGYDTGFFEPASWVKARGGKTIVCQMDPSRTEVEMIEEERGRWPGWAKGKIVVPEAFFKRREREWEIADLVMVNSEWTKMALISQGVSEEKIVVVPLAYEADLLRVDSQGVIDGVQKKSGFSQRHPLRVLFLGQVILRKGIQYLVEAARLLEKEPIHFDVVGPIGISSEAVNSAPNNMTFHGSIARNRTSDFLLKADIFVLPTLSDGFALTQLEAMAYGLPVICTPNCGAVVTHDVDGLIVPVRDENKLAESIRSLMIDPERLNAMSHAAEKKVQEFSLKKLGENLELLSFRLSN